MKYRVLCLPCLLLLTTLLYAQDNSPLPMANVRHHGLDGMQSLSGSVHTATGQPVSNARVELRTFGTGQPVASGYTLPNGTFEFDNLQQGMYEVVATAGINEARQRVQLFQPESGVRLTMAGNQSATAAPGSATVSVSQMKVPDKARKLYEKADQAFQKQKYGQARDELEKALHVFPNYAQALTLRGIMHMQENRLDRACADLEQAIQSDRNFGMSYVVLGASYNLMKRFDDSMRTLEHAIVLMPASWQPHFEMAKAQLGKGQFPAALRQINKAAELAPENYPALHLVKAHALLGVKDYNLAVAELEKFLGADPNGVESAKARETLNQVKSFMSSNGK